ncbi:hypothetical protein EV2_003520 [Malus domestica]
MLALFNRRVVQNPLCPLCKEFPESSEHVLFLCPWTIGVWTVGVNTDSQSWVYTAASFICWEIWKSRCNCIFHGSVPSPEFTAEKASRAAAEFFKSGLGVVFRSSNETIINGVSTPCLSSSALQTEAKAALLAVWSTKDSNFSDFRSLNWRWVPRRIVKEGCVLMFG